MDEQNQQQALPPQQPTIPPQNVNPMPPPQQPLYGKRNWIKWVLIIVLVALLAPITTYFVLNSQSQKPPPSQIVQTTPSPTPTPDPTANWKIYSSTKYGLSFQYPSTLDSACCNISGAMIGNPERIIVLADKTTTQQGTDKPFDGVAVYVVSTQKSLNAYIEEEKNAQLNTKKEFAGNNTPGTKSSFALNNKQGVVLKGYSWDSITRYYAPFSNNQYILVIAKSEQAPSSFDTTFNQILSTFKFTD